jgi:hypothetical protein
VRGLDPETCEAIDFFVEKVQSIYGDIENFWHEVLDSDGDGICSRLEFVTYTKKALEISGKTAGSIFTMLDTVNVGWIAMPEFGYLHAFVPHTVEAEVEPMNASGDSLIPFPSISDRRSLSTGQLPSRSLQQADSTFSDIGWMSSRDAMTTGSSFMRSSSSTSKSSFMDKLPQSRGACLRQLANTQLAKTRWMGPATAAKSYSLTEGTPFAVYKKQVLPGMPTVGIDVHSMTYRTTNEFYREGMRRIKATHERHEKELQARLERASRKSDKSDRSSPSSHGKGGRSPKSSRANKA